MREEERDVSLKTQDTIGKILSKLHRSNTPKPLDHAETCYRRCPHVGCKKCLAYSEDGKRAEIPLLRRYGKYHERVYEYCPFCKEPLGRGFDPESSRKLGRKSSLKLLNNLRR